MINAKQLLEEQLQEKDGFRSVFKQVGIYIKINNNTVIHSEVDIHDLQRILYDVIALIPVNFYSINNSSCGFSLQCNCLKYLLVDSNSTPDFLD